MKFKSGLFFLPAILLACNSVDRTPPETVPHAFCIPDSLSGQIRIDTVKAMPVINEFKLVGQITFDQDKVVRLYPMTSGVVTTVNFALGDYVKQGQELATIHSSEIAGAQNELVAARAGVALAEKNLSSVTDLYNSGISSEKDLEAARQEKAKTMSELERVKTILSIYGARESDVVVRAPVSGYIVEKFINPMMQIRSDFAGPLLTISDLGKLWVMANVYESDIPNIHSGEEAEISTLSYPGKIFRGIIDRAYNVLDTDSRTMPVRVQLENHDNLLKPGMFAEVVVSEKTDSVMACVPASCLIFDRNRSWAVVCRGNCDLHAVPVEIDKTGSRFAWIRSGLKPGDRVLASRQLLIYSAITQ